MLRHGAGASPEMCSQGVLSKERSSRPPRKWQCVLWSKAGSVPCSAGHFWMRIFTRDIFLTKGKKSKRDFFPFLLRFCFQRFSQFSTALGSAGASVVGGVQWLPSVSLETTPRIHQALQGHCHGGQEGGRCLISLAKNWDKTLGCAHPAPILSCYI